jgi:hypothetical protein
MLSAGWVFENWGKRTRRGDFGTDQGEPGYYIDGGWWVDDGRDRTETEAKRTYGRFYQWIPHLYQKHNQLPHHCEVLWKGELQTTKHSFTQNSKRIVCTILG